ncbi:hypothetical protein SUDANB178_06443 [Streptomyces sp. enrichment culture]
MDDTVTTMVIDYLAPSLDTSISVVSRPSHSLRAVRP